ncbi:tripartite tricarboxylate transporter substrate binding protein [Roseococcus sp. SDR]|uniref:Bug family tripartite tricarboxylate transporter substrate binding protein n=1 Tax=Roseococcus sp. SDR TaxID=2835532 RepID=UPI001BCF165D|nr:tripartite tricarboxylate transporter substrate-binding protein [Roseococcus sp. SDR]MBS7790903.1 tripartite tricarboxylate transporter substrate binding protein [Roseococcus sp. SDR]MBV1846217.1 tripartite tricarboxylate transporter substrate binding protein [Roseococcus sp. SDR]
MFTRRTGLAMAMGTLATPAIAQSWPSRPIRLIVPDTPGTGNDVTARLFAPLLEAALGQPWVVENRTGAGGRIGVEAAFRAAPDGSTFLLGNAGSNGINAAIYRDLPYDLLTAFDPVSLLVIGPNTLFVNPRQIPVNSVAELIAYVRARPGQLSYASAGIGSSAHMSMALFLSRTGLDIQHVPYRGAAGLAQAVVTGEAPVAFANLVNIMPQARAGEVRLLAVTTRTRDPGLPEIPTMEEAGLAGFETLAWNALFAPRGTPGGIREKLGSELAKLRDNHDLAERIRLLGGALVISTPAELRARVTADIGQWRRLAEAANIQAQ